MSVEQSERGAGEEQRIAVRPAARPRPGRRGRRKGVLGQRVGRVLRPPRTPPARRGSALAEFGEAVRRWGEIGANHLGMVNPRRRSVTWFGGLSAPACRVVWMSDNVDLSDTYSIRTVVKGHFQRLRAPRVWLEHSLTCGRSHQSQEIGQIGPASDNSCLELNEAVSRHDARSRSTPLAHRSERTAGLRRDG
jgi:hypothetical protein